MPDAGREVLEGFLPEHRAARRWFGLALGVLILAGVFAVVVVRMPPMHVPCRF